MTIRQSGRERDEPSLTTAKFRFVDSNDTQLTAEPYADTTTPEIHVVVEDRQGEDTFTSIVELSATDARRLGSYLVAWADAVDGDV